MNRKESIRLNLEQKKQIIQYAMYNPKVSHKVIAATKFADKYGLSHISKQTMSRIMNEDYSKKLLKSVSCDSPSSKYVRESKYPVIQHLYYNRVMLE